MAAILQAHGRVDGLVNNAGGQFAAPLASISQKGWETVVRTNLTGGFLMARECYTQWMRAHGGAIVNIVADMWRACRPWGTRARREPGWSTSRRRRRASGRHRACASTLWRRAGLPSSGMDHYPPEMGEHIRAMKDKVPLGRLGTESEVSAAICVPAVGRLAIHFGNDAARRRLRCPTTRSAYQLPPNPNPVPAYDGFHRAVRPKVLGDDRVAANERSSKSRDRNTKKSEAFQANRRRYACA